MKAYAVVRTIIVALVIASGSPVEAVSASERSITLNEAIELALRRNEGLFIERESQAASRAAVTRARGAYDPLLELDAGWSRSTEPLGSSFLGTTPGAIAPEFESREAGVSIQQLLPTGGRLSLRARGARETNEDSLAFLSPAYRTRVGAELRQPLLRDRGTDAARLSVRVARAGRAGARASLRRVVAETVASVERAYWTLSEARLRVDVREAAVSLAEDQLEETEERIETGASPRTEIAEPRAELERRRGDLLASREALARAQNTLKLLVLEGAEDPLWPADLAPAEDAAIEVRAVDVAGAMERALAERPELEIAGAAIQRRRAEAAYARDGVWPSLDAVFSYDRFGLSGSSASSGGMLPAELDGGLGRSFDSLERGGYDAARVALVLGLPIGNRTARGNAAMARHAERQAEADLGRVRKTIRAEVLDAAAAIQTTGQRIEAARSGREAAERQLQSERDRYDAGLSTNFLVLTRQNDLSRARLDEIAARTDYRRARTELGRATGTLIEEYDIAVEEPTR